MAKSPDVRELIDGFLASHKPLMGRPDWEPDAVDGVYRWVSALEFHGEISGFTLTIKAYPRSHELMFRLILAMDKAVWRLDFAYDEPHTNSFDAPSDIRGLVVTERHYHSWADNRRFATAGSLPARLHNARILPNNVRTFENALRWFCGETGINGLDEFGIPTLPKAAGFI